MSREWNFHNFFLRAPQLEMECNDDGSTSLHVPHHHECQMHSQSRSKS